MEKFEISNSVNRKELEKQKVKQETQKELSEFDILKESTKQFDIFKSKLNNLNLPDNFKDKIMNNATLLFYSKDNDEIKLKWIKYLNWLIDTINENKDNMITMKEKIQEYINSSLDSDVGIEWWLFVWSIIVLVFFVLWSVWEMFSAWVWITLWVITLIWVLNDLRIFNNNRGLRSKNKLFDMINDMFPQINEEEFKKIYDLYDDGKLNMVKFTKMMEKYEKDWKITPEERKKIDEFISKPSI